MNYITAKEAQKLALDIKKQANELADEAVGIILKRLDSTVRNEVLFGNFQTELNIVEISTLLIVNVEASKLAAWLLSSELQRLGYLFDNFTNHDSSITIKWTI